ncbi:flagellar biosynthesis protein FlgA [Methylobacterium sp. Leaf399]|uniref:flagellar basal body P-ring formation chaperone FlgA n=1 Tax=unclassified Methylobacterium TaxID=2615210 RepID=UPI0006F7A1FB|nr:MULTISPECIES: flagellar basal body P-ring formation chaperone FlgA [unclassified Methylobacterium]KQP58121.1 flagellar biosynthesis protein FlgA [Methylobacterium sp. Leaf108]KQT16183.1 flagellar biosynthesis protein FlgA [Methylobacterium sp. Leaf399]
MYVLKPVRQVRRPRVIPLGAGVVLRTLLALAILGFIALPVLAEPARLRLRGDVTAKGDVLMLGDLLEGAGAEAARHPLFRAPALGASGTIQARRIAEAVARLGLGEIETGGRVQVAVQRAARRVGATEIEAAIKRALESGYGLESRSLALRLDGESPVLLAPLDLDGQATAMDLTYDPRLKRVAALITLGDRQASLRVSGQIVEIREVVVLGRALNRGEAVTAADVAIERRPREATPADAQAGTANLFGQVALRTLGAGAVLRSGDVAPPDLVTRGEAVTLVFDSPGLNLSLRGLANESGKLGGMVGVTNPISKKVVTGTVIGPGRVSVGPAAPVRQASAALDPAR